MTNHVVNKVSLQFSADNYDQAAEYQHNAKHWANHYLPTLLNHSFETLNNKDDFFFIDKIELEVSDHPWKISDAEWINIITTEIKKQKHSLNQTNQIIKQWLFYLNYGVFERNAYVKNIQDFELYFSKQKQSFTQEDVPILTDVFESANTTKRFFIQHSTEFIKLFFSEVLKIDKQQAEKITIYFIYQFKQHSQNAFYNFRYLIDIVQKHNIQELAEFVLLIDDKRNEIELNTIIESKNTRILLNNKNSNIKSIIDTSVECANAGLVVLLPFIQRFFENVGWIIANDFINENCKYKAVQALHFMASGNQTANENELLLPKIICGIDLHEMIELNEKIESKTLDEMHEVLNAVINHWSILQNTSIDGLRESFLKRDGKLTVENNQYLLQVAESGVDILLDKIPWGFRNYKLPWMQKSLITEWH